MQIIDQKKSSSRSICLNLISACNLKCSWCYKQGDREAYLDLTKFEMFLERIIRSNIDHVTLIGGEPTIHPNFFEILKLLKEKQISVTTNGLAFSDLEFMNNCIENGLGVICVSLKGYDKESFFSATSVDGFESLCRAIRNLETGNIPVTYSYTFAETMTNCQIERFIEFLRKYHINEIVLNDVRPYFNASNMLVHPEPVEGLDDLVACLEDIGIEADLRLNHPFCKYDTKLIHYALTNHRLISKCAVKKGIGYFFSSSLDLIPCNELSSVTLGTFGEEFQDFVELEQLWNSYQVQNFYQKLSGYPDMQCEQCNFWKMCGGSCILHWLNKED